MFEDTTKQLNESHILQTQLADRLEDTKTKYVNLQNEHNDKIKELLNRLNHYEGNYKGCF